MRTKSLFAAAAILAAGFATASAQSNVYSLNVVGYVNVVLKGAGSFNLLANPLKTSNDSLTNLFATGANDGDAIFVWNPVASDFVSGPAYSGFFNAWSANVALPVGRGFFYASDPGSPDRTNTFVGEVVQGSYSNFIFGAGSFNAIGSSAPIGGSFTNAIEGITPQDGDAVFKWNNVSSSFGVSSTYSGFFSAWSSTAIQIAPGEGLFYASDPGSPNAVWTRNFTVPTP